MYLSIRKNSKAVISFILICLFAYSVAVALLKILEEKTLGSIFRHFLPAIPILFLIVLFNLYDIKKISFSSFIPTIPSNLEFDLILKRFALILLLVIPLGLLAYRYLGEAGLLVGPVIIFLVISMFISCFFMITEKTMFGALIFIATIPFLYFIQGQLYLMGLKELIISEITIPFSSIFLIIISIFFFMGQFHRNSKDFSGEEKKFIRLCAFFVLVPIFSIIFSKDPSHSFVYYLMDLFLPIIFFFILMRSIKTIEDIEKLIVALIISTFLYEFFALYFMYQQGGIAQITSKLYGLRIYTGFAVTLLPLMLPFQIVMYNLLRGWKRVSMGLMLILFIIYLFLGNYRTAIGASVIGFIIFYYFYYRTSLSKKLFLSILALLFVVISVSYIENILEKLSFFKPIRTIQQITAEESITRISSNRIKIWQGALNMIYDHPLLGIGPDMWSHHIPQYSLIKYYYRDFLNRRFRYYSIDPHNLYLLIWLNYGIVNFICYLSILYIVIRNGLRNIKESSSEQMRTFSVGVFISLSIWIVMGFFTMRFFNHSILLYAIIFWSIIAVIFKLSEFNSTIKAQNT